MYKSKLDLIETEDPNEFMGGYIVNLEQKNPKLEESKLEESKLEESKLEEKEEEDTQSESISSDVEALENKLKAIFESKDDNVQEGGNDEDVIYKEKYLKYKQKYLDLKKTFN